MEIISLVGITENCYTYQGALPIDGVDTMFVATLKKDRIIDIIATQINKIGVIIVCGPDVIQKAVDILYKKLDLHHDVIA